MSSQLPRPSASAGAASGRAVIRGKLSIATQRQRERAMLLAHVDKSREPTIDKTRAFNRAALATPSSVERAHRLLQRSAIKLLDVSLRAQTMSPVLEFPATIPDPTTIERVASPVVEMLATIPELPPPVGRVTDEQHVGGGGRIGKKNGYSIRGGDSSIGNQDTAPSMPPSKATQEKTFDENNDSYYRCAAHRLCRSMGDQTSQFLMCINCNELVHLFCAEYLIDQTPVAEETLYISVKDFTKEGKARGRKPRLLTRMTLRFVFSVRPR